MSFITIEYYIFLLFVVLLTYAIRIKFRWVILLFASYLFYASIHIEYSIVMLTSTVIAYFTAIMMYRFKNWSILFFCIGILTDLSLLFFFKYFGFFLENVNLLFGSDFDTNYSIAQNIILPIGISFYTFQSLSYTIDVYKRKREPERHFGYYALYISFFPQLVAGPIERSAYLIPQLKKKVTPAFNYLIQGGKLIIWGLFKKIVIADTIGTFVNYVFSNTSEYNSLEIALSVYAFAFQVYFDFSGYTNIAIGSAKIFGIDLSMNFNSPLTSRTLTELWTKWHITLMNFFTSYIFRPLIKSGRLFRKWNSAAILIVFFISGLWHGASWNFVLFGLVNGIAIIIERKTKFARKIRQRNKKRNLSFFFNLVLIFYSLTILSFSSIWFKTDTFDQGIDILTRIGNFSFGNTNIWTVSYIIMLMLIGMAADYLRKNYLSTPVEIIKHNYIRLTIYVILIVMIMLYSYNDEVTFIYYQF